MKEGFANVVLALRSLPDGMKSPRNGGTRAFRCGLPTESTAVGGGAGAYRSGPLSSSGVKRDIGESIRLVVRTTHCDDFASPRGIPSSKRCSERTYPEMNLC